MITLIASIDKQTNAIGRAGQLLYHISDDLRRFKALTTGHTVVMGRKTFESLPKGALPNRRNIVVTRNKDFRASGTETATSLAEAIKMCEGEEIFIIGGAQIYTAAIPMADRLEITEITPTVENISGSAPDVSTISSAPDVFFPAIDPEVWAITTATDPVTDTKTNLTYRFVTYHRRK